MSFFFLLLGSREAPGEWQDRPFIWYSRAFPMILCTLENIMWEVILNCFPKQGRAIVQWWHPCFECKDSKFNFQEGVEKTLDWKSEELRLVHVKNTELNRLTVWLGKSFYIQSLVSLLKGFGVVGLGKDFSGILRESCYQPEWTIPWARWQIHMFMIFQLLVIWIRREGIS